MLARQTDSSNGGVMCTQYSPELMLYATAGSIAPPVIYRPHHPTPSQLLHATDAVYQQEPKTVCAVSLASQSILMSEASTPIGTRYQGICVVRQPYLMAQSHVRL